MSKTFYITTPIYYVNAHPHIGHTYTTLACDAVARRQRVMGADTWFLTGTDEHGQKIQRAAEAAGKTPQKFTDEVSAEFRALWDRMGISYNDYIRTTSDRHKRGVQDLWRRIRDNRYIYKGSYTGQYCVFDEMYVEVGPGEPCPECGRPTETVKEENYFFKLSAFAEPLLDLYTSQPDFIRPETRRNEVIAFVRSGLRDLSISRSTFSWGIPVPDDPGHVIYVWLDALANYITALGYGSPDTSKYEKYWPADVHMIGKEIVRFHCVYWPAFLMAARLPLPKAIVAHGWLLFEENKMSKSRGNIVRTETILDVLGADALRYFLLREVVFGSDGSFSFDALVQRYNSDLANGLGNLASRTLAMITRYFKSEVPYPSHKAAHTPQEDLVAALAKHTIKEFNELFEQFQFSRALEMAWALVAAVDKYIVENEPWALAEKQDESHRARLATVLYTSAEALRIVTALAHPVIPQATAKIWSQMGLGDITKVSLADLRWGQLPLGTKLGKVEPVFPRADKSTIERMQKMEEQQRPAAADGQSGAAETAHVEADARTRPASPQPLSATSLAVDGKITIDDFAKVELRVAQVKVAERVKGADKLLRLEVDLGTETRQILAGIAEAYAPETLIGRKIVIVANLAPRKLRGLDSNGMLLAASLEGGKPVLASFLEDVPVGARLK
jgi:methionyl-tRNA synthetase